MAFNPWKVVILSTKFPHIVIISGAAWAYNGSCNTCVANLCWWIFPKMQSPRSCIRRVPKSLISHLVPREIQILVAEVLTLVQPFFFFFFDPGFFPEFAITFHIYNVAATQCLVKGNSKAVDLSHLFGGFHALLTLVKVVCWLECVVSTSNRSDGGTRFVMFLKMSFPKGLAVFQPFGKNASA